MNYRRAYEIAFVGLKPGIHEFNYELDDSFFVPYGVQDFTNCKATIKVQLEKQNSVMLLKFDVDGQIDVICDRCGNNLTLQLWDEFKVVVKMVDNPHQMNENEEDPDIYYISKGEGYLYLADWMYEFINLSIPLQKMCADNEKGGSKCNIEVLKKLNGIEEANKNAASLWKGLDKFKNLE
jgi:uncharacterized metal-binding protein YceD (DUF177 family)